MSDPTASGAPLPIVYGTASVSADVVPVFVPAPSPASVLVDAWFAETFFNLALDVALSNRFNAAKDVLKARLAALPRE
jgi:hypothetical protein